MIKRRLAVFVVAAGLVAGPPVGATPAPSNGHEPVGPVVVIAVIDSGINPYHSAYRDESPLGEMYPGEYLPDFPPDVPALHLTLDASSVTAALVADCESVWSTVEPGRLYWIPGTRIIGAISWPYSADVRPEAVIDLTEDRSWEVDCSTTPPRIPPIVTTGGHGNMVSSKIVGEDIGHCEDVHCRLVVVDAPNQEGLDFVGSNTDWIDIQTNQRYIPVTTSTPLSEGYNDFHGAEVALTPALARSIEEAAQQHLSLWSAGNGYPISTQTDGRLTPSVVIVGGHDNGYPLAPLVASRFIGPGTASGPAHVSGDICFNWAAQPHSLDGYSKSGGGTSSAAPYAAGGAAAILLEARRILDHRGSGIHDGVAAQGYPPEWLDDGPLQDGTLTLDEWKMLLLRTATARPGYQHSDGDRCAFPDATAYDAVNGPSWSELPEGYPVFLEIGYGAVDNASISQAMDVLRGVAVLPERPELESFFEMDRAIRELQYEINTA